MPILIDRYEENTGYDGGDDLAEPLYRCCMCHCDIIPGDDYYKLDGDIVCDECLPDYFANYKHTAGEGDNE